MAEIRIKDNESLRAHSDALRSSAQERALFRKFARERAYEKPSVKRKKKSEAARKRKYK